MQRLPSTRVYSVASLCDHYGISRAFLYKLWNQKKGPRRFKIGRCTFITDEAAAEWQRKMENATNEAPDDYKRKMHELEGKHKLSPTTERG